MRTAYCPKTHTELADVTVGDADGHVPGNQYHDVHCVVSYPAASGLFRCHVVESWGSAQGRDEEHGRREVIGRGLTIHGACSDAMSRGLSSGIGEEYLQQATSQAMDAAVEARE
jgi:hypothetical protein